MAASKKYFLLAANQAAFCLNIFVTSLDVNLSYIWSSNVSTKTALNAANKIMNKIPNAN